MEVLFTIHDPIVFIRVIGGLDSDRFRDDTYFFLNFSHTTHLETSFSHWGNFQLTVSPIHILSKLDDAVVINPGCPVKNMNIYRGGQRGVFEIELNLGNKVHGCWAMEVISRWRQNARTEGFLFSFAV